jgi:hypothetical protein
VAGGKPVRLPPTAPAGVMALPYSDWIGQTVTFTGPEDGLVSLRKAAAGSAIAPWIIDYDRRRLTLHQAVLRPPMKMCSILELRATSANQNRPHVLIRDKSCSGVVWIEQIVNMSTVCCLPVLRSCRPRHWSPADKSHGALSTMAEQNTHTRGTVKDPEHDGRLKENREENTSKNASHSSSRQSSSRTQGAVKDPEHDGRLKGNREDATNKEASTQSSGHTTGAVTDPEHDGRLRENREKGVHKGD